MSSFVHPSPVWVGQAQVLMVTITGVPYLHCDICGAAIIQGVPDGSRIVATGEYSQFGKEYRLDPDINTPEWWEEAKKRLGYTHHTLHGKTFVVCSKCNRK